MKARNQLEGRYVWLLSASGAQQSCCSAASSPTFGRTAGLQDIIGMSIKAFSHGQVFITVCFVEFRTKL